MELCNEADFQFRVWEDPYGVHVVIDKTKWLLAFVNIGKLQAWRTLRSFKNE